MVDVEEEVKEKRHEIEKGRNEGETEERPNATLISSIIKDIFSDPRFASIVETRISKCLLGIKEDIEKIHCWS